MVVETSFTTNHAKSNCDASFYSTTWCDLCISMPPIVVLGVVTVSMLMSPMMSYHVLVAPRPLTLMLNGYCSGTSIWNRASCREGRRQPPPHSSTSRKVVDEHNKPQRCFLEP
ncbi:hypothetical protein SESBI_06542 [Sesbania bispinosa]|nr:hypothetical protein SESBI_06542 [Sesbania bispinosa]